MLFFIYSLKISKIFKYRRIKYIHLLLPQLSPASQEVSELSTIKLFCYDSCTDTNDPPIDFVPVY